MLNRINARMRIVLVMLAAMLPILALMVYGGIEQRRAAEAGERRQLQLIAELAVKRPEQVIEGARLVMVSISDHADQLLADRKYCHDFFKRMQRSSAPQFHGMGLILPNGRLFCNSVSPDAKADLSDRYYFRLAVSSGRFVVGDYQTGRATRQQGLNFAYPVMDAEGKPQAVLFLALNLAKFSEQGEVRLSGLQQDFGRVMTVVDRDGTVLAQQPIFRARIGEKVPNPVVLQQVMNLKSGMFAATDLAGVKRIYAVESVGVNPDGVVPIRVMVSTPEPLIYAQANRSLWHTLAGVGLVLVLMLVIAWYGTTELVLRPFRRLLEVADRVRAGDFSARCGLGSGNEELTRLGNALDTMVQELQNRDGQLKEVVRQLNEQAVTDQLTGLPNRRYLWDVLEAELLRSERKQTPLAVLMLDIDFFKEFNDRWGHEAGDLVLRNVAFALRQVVRGSDIVARHGGEEFVIVLPESTREVALARAEELRAAVAALRLTYAGESLGAITVSVGVTVSEDQHESAEALVRAADHAMYEAKRAGRNRIVFGRA